MARALVTGATAGIGAVYARRLAERGTDLVLVGRRAERLDALARDLGTVDVEPIAADLADPQDLERVAERASGPDIGLLVNSAGINGYGPFAEVDPATLAGVVAVNVTALMRLTRAAVPGMLDRGEGAVVNIASLLAFAGARPPGPLPVRATYAGTKGFVAAFTRTLAAELADSPVRIQLLCPGYVKTEFHLTNGTDPVDGTAPADQPPIAMEPEDVVAASLRALDAGEVVCAPGLDDPAAIDGLVEAETAILQANRAALASRYADG